MDIIVTFRLLLHYFETHARYLMTRFLEKALIIISAPLPPYIIITTLTL